MNEGKRFENNVKKSVDANTYFLRLNDSSPAGYGDQKTMRFSLQSPYDIILFKNNKMYSVELKSTKAKSISFDGSSPMIKKHQLKELERALCYGINAGFLLNFRTSET
ncbi:MAG TPA: hypothetical protein VJ083_03665, partial [Sedimentibacter sp.]|nr:hypothetical protein [Sedimentibacter sp.]